MAHLSRREGERGQLILVTGFVLALTFVSLALILNSAIFTENLATRSESVGGNGPVETSDIVVEGIGGVMGYANANNNTEDGDPTANVSEAVARMDNFTAQQYATRGQVVSLTFQTARDGSRIVHNNTSRAFISDDENEDWTPVADVGMIRDVGFNVSRDSLAEEEDCPFEDCFRANVTGDSGGVWGVAIYRDGDDIVAESYDGSGVIGTCRAVDTEVAAVNLSTGRVGGEVCQTMRFGEGVSPNYDLSIDNGDEAMGTYSMITTDPGLVGSFLSLLNGPDSDESPRTTYAIYAAEVKLTYVTDGVEYTVNLRIAPGEPA